MQQIPINFETESDAIDQYIATHLGGPDDIDAPGLSRLWDAVQAPAQTVNTSTTIDSNDRQMYEQRVADGDFGRIGSEIVAIRTYRQIAQIMVLREGVSISPARVMKICLSAEKKLAMALQTPSTATAQRGKTG